MYLDIINTVKTRITNLPVSDMFTNKNLWSRVFVIAVGVLLVIAYIHVDRHLLKIRDRQRSARSDLSDKTNSITTQLRQLKDSTNILYKKFELLSRKEDSITAQLRELKDRTQPLPLLYERVELLSRKEERQEVENKLAEANEELESFKEEFATYRATAEEKEVQLEIQAVMLGLDVHAAETKIRNLTRELGSKTSELYEGGQEGTQATHVTFGKENFITQDNNSIYNVIEKTNISLKYDCEKIDCLRPYFEFPEHHPEYRIEISQEELNRRVGIAKKLRKQRPTHVYKINASEEELRRQIAEETEKLRRQKKDARKGLESSSFNLSAAQLRNKVLKCLNIRFLVENINSTKLVVTTIAETDYGDYIEKELVFEDEHIGVFDVLMLIPRQERIEFPAIIGLHGHSDSNTTFRDGYMGIDLVREGFVVVMPSSRAMQVDGDEYRIGDILLLNGFSLQSIRVYEVLLLIKYLKYIDGGGGVDSTKIGIIGHSGGSTTANLVVRVTDDVKAQVTDFKHNYLVGPPFHCETVPHLSYFNEEINDRNTLSFPMLRVPYGFKDCRNVIREFFVEFLKQ